MTIFIWNIVILFLFVSKYLNYDANPMSSKVSCSYDSSLKVEIGNRALAQAWKNKFQDSGNEKEPF